MRTDRLKLEDMSRCDCGNSYRTKRFYFSKCPECLNNIEIQLKRDQKRMIDKYRESIDKAST